MDCPVNIEAMYTSLSADASSKVAKGSVTEAPNRRLKAADVNAGRDAEEAAAERMIFLDWAST